MNAISIPDILYFGFVCMAGGLIATGLVVSIEHFAAKIKQMRQERIL
jgi:hypothetical protein